MKRVLILLAALILVVIVVPETKGQSYSVYEVKIYPVVGCNEPDLVFSYTFGSRAKAWDFARRIASQGLERKIQPTAPRRERILILYPTIKRIVVRRLQRSYLRGRREQ